MLNKIVNSNKLSEEQKTTLILVSVFHDIVYNPTKNDNEEESVKLFKHYCGNNIGDKINEISKIILDTKNHTPSNENSKTFCYLDNFILIKGELFDLFEYEDKIAKEFQFVPYAIYKTKRIEFLEKWLKSNKDINKNNIDILIQYINNRKLNIAVIIGNFKKAGVEIVNDIINKTNKAFDKTIIAKLVEGKDKSIAMELEAKVPLKSIFPFNQTEIKTISELNDFFQEEKHTYTIIRGIKNESTIEHEKQFFEDLKKYEFCADKAMLYHLIN